MYQLNEIGLEIIDFLSKPCPLTIFRTAFIVFNHLTQDNSRLAGSAFILLYDGECLLLHTMTVIRFLKQADDLPYEFLLIINGNAGIAILEQGMRIFEIKHIMTNYNCLAMRCRFQYIMSAMWNQTAPHIDHITDTVNFSQLTNRIQDDNIRAAGSCLPGCPGCDRK